MQNKTCKGTTRKGRPCQKKPSNGKNFCHFHAPKEEDEKCPICLESTEDLFELSCHHKIHLECLNNVPGSTCVICRQEMENLPSEILEKVRSNEKEYKNELEEEDRLLAERSSLQLGNLFSVYIRPPPNIEIRYALLYLKSHGVPLRYIPSSIKIHCPRNHPNPPPGVFFSTLVGHTLQKMKEDISGLEEDHETSESDSEDDPFEGEFSSNPQVLIDILSVNPSELE